MALSKILPKKLLSQAFLFVRVVVVLLWNAPIAVAFATPSIAEITYRGVFDCFDPSLSDPQEGRDPVVCEPSAVVQAEGQLYIASDKDIPGASSVITAQLDGNSLTRIGYVDVPRVHQLRKAEDFALEPQKGKRVFLASGFDRFFPDDSSKDAYNTLLTWKVGKEAKARVIEPTGSPASSLSLRPRLMRALTTEQFPSGAPYWKVEGLAMLPDQTMLFGLREVGASYKDFDYTLRLVASRWNEETPKYLGNFKQIYDYDPQSHPQIDRPVGLSSLSWDQYHQQLLITTSYELGETDAEIGAYLWTLSLGDLEAQNPPTLVTKMNGDPLIFAHKTEGITALSATQLLAIHDDDRVVGDPDIDDPETEFYRQPYQGAYSLVEWR